MEDVILLKAYPYLEVIKSGYLHFFYLYNTLYTIFCTKKRTKMNDKQIVIYQLLPRLFGNKNTTNTPYGTIEQNGSGKFNDITDKALDGIKELHVNYVWYTGAIAHASLTDYSAYGIKVDDADVVKGRAGSPYAIRDYYDVDPDLAVDVKNRMDEFEALIKRTHAKNLKILIDFVPNHVARSYHSYSKPDGVVDFGAEDEVTKAFSPKNDFYYIPGQALVVPANGQKHHFRHFRMLSLKRIQQKQLGTMCFLLSLNTMIGTKPSS